MVKANMQILLRWTIGICIGTLIIGATSPLFIRSYVPRQVNRGHLTLASGHDYRWRSEGYATTRIGPLGMPGKTSIDLQGPMERRPITQRAALWGDSQAEGVCVDDRSKIFAIAQRLCGDAGENDLRLDLSIFPFAQSGEDLADWLPQMGSVERQLDLDVHVILMTELLDFRLDRLVADQATIDTTQNWMAENLPAFVIQAARHLMTDGNDETPRRLRFGIGPVNASPPSIDRPAGAAEVPAAKLPTTEPSTDWNEVVSAIRSKTNRPIVIVYSPVLPRIVGGTVIVEDPDAKDVEAFRAVAQRSGIVFIDVRDDFRRSVSRGDWPHGFHNGQFGVGH